MRIASTFGKIPFLLREPFLRSEMVEHLRLARRLGERNRFFVKQIDFFFGIAQNELFANPLLVGRITYVRKNNGIHCADCPIVHCFCIDKNLLKRLTRLTSYFCSATILAIQELAILGLYRFI